MLDAVLLWLEKNQKRHLEELGQWLSIPSVSAQPEHAGDVREAAGWAGDYLRGIGMQVEVIETAGHPCVWATTPEGLCEAGAPQVLLYGHYDVQPAEPLDLWQTPAFKATVREGKIFARGASDDKGQVHCHLAALRAWREISGGLPCRVSVLLEGEEEVGSPNFMGVLKGRVAELAGVRTALISDSNQFAPGVPAITYGLRGLVYFEIKLTAANSDLHSGMYGGAVPNPANILAKVLADLHDATGRVTIPGFYDDVLELTEEEKRMWAGLAFDEAGFMKELGLQVLAGEEGYSTLARKWARPTLDINGLTAGYQGAGAKTVLPGSASAKFSCRLVPNQKPGKIAKLVHEHIAKLVPAGIGCELKEIGAGSPPALTPMESEAMGAAAEAMEIGFGKKPVFTREGGSIPVVNWFKEVLGLDTVMVGFGLPNDHIHAPNEKLDLECYFGGLKTAAALYGKLGEKLK